jgi:hypothetical protein
MAKKMIQIGGKKIIKNSSDCKRPTKQGKCPKTDPKRPVKQGTPKSSKVKKKKKKKEV